MSKPKSVLTKLSLVRLFILIACFIGLSCMGCTSTPPDDFHQDATHVNDTHMERNDEPAGDSEQLTEMEEDTQVIQEDQGTDEDSHAIEETHQDIAVPHETTHGVPAKAQSNPAAAKDTQGASHAVVEEEVEVASTGTAFVNALTTPLSYELNDRFWGWRPNDIFYFLTDNVRYSQLGILEVTRRATVKLAERISRTGSSAILDPNLENAMNWFMIRPDKYWFPSAESKYKAGINELNEYKEKLKKGEATFYNRADNLIPLLESFKDLLGSCDENLAKHYEEDGSPVSSFDSDNYFFYARGVAGAMVTILHAVEKDFNSVLSTRAGMESLHHAIESCEYAVHMDPWIIFEGDLDGFLANHRANMATNISHARFYVEVLIATLST